jgi:hypothetical protein
MICCHLGIAKQWAFIQNVTQLYRQTK